VDDALPAGIQVGVRGMSRHGCTADEDRDAVDGGGGTPGGEDES